MTIAEFKAWFEGFSENITEEGPNPYQWTRIQERLAEVEVPTLNFPKTPVYRSPLEYISGGVGSLDSNGNAR